MLRIIIVALLYVCVALPVYALEEEKWEEYSSEEFQKEKITDYIPQYVKTPKGGLDWGILAATKETAYKDKDSQGYDIEGTKPEFTPEVKKLDKTEVIMQGYMFPLEPGEKQARFLFGPFPVTCPYHYHVGPSLVIEVFTTIPVPFSYDPVTLRGRLELVPRDDDFNVFYRIKDAKILP